MSNYIKSILLDPNGTQVWEGPSNDSRAILGYVKDSDAYASLSLALGVALKTKSKASEVFSEMERAKLVSGEGCVKGFLNVLPKGTAFESRVEQFNQEALLSLAAERIDFPIVFDAGQSDIKELTLDYEMQNRLFKIESGSCWRLSYAADPGLFSWLRKRRLDEKSLPFAIYSPTNMLRYWKTGELNGLNRTRQFSMPDLHLLADPKNAFESLMVIARQGHEGSRFWLGESWVQVCDVDSKFLGDHPGSMEQLAKLAKQWTLVQILEKRPRYYALKVGLMADAGFSELMLYNIQWDDTNAERFQITLGDERRPVVLHATLISAISRLIPILIGRALSGRGSLRFPAALALSPLSLIPKNSEDVEYANRVASELKGQGVNATVSEMEKDLSKRIRTVVNNWTPFFGVIGAKERQGESIQVQAHPGDKGVSLDEWLSRELPHIIRCNPTRSVGTGRDPFLRVHT